MEAKDELKEIFQYAIYRLDNNLCTPEEIDSFADAAKTTLNLRGTMDDFSKFFGKTKDAVSSVIKRRMIEKPMRNVVLYDFNLFRKIVPPSWHKKD